MSKNIFIYSNNKDYSLEAYERLKSKIIERNWNVVDEYENADYLICIGGDGTFLSFVHKLRFPSIPIIGINTGHLGFFQEANPQQIDSVLETLENGSFAIQTINPVKCRIVCDRNEFQRIGINEIIVRGTLSHITRIAVSIDKTKIQDFSGDGVLISTPVGSTAYNYSLGGSLVSPDLNVLQITPIAPMNTNAYRCFHSSILLPADKTIRISGVGRNANSTMMVSFDGRTHEFNNVKYIEVSQSDNTIQLMRFSDYDYWSKLSTKLL